MTTRIGWEATLLPPTVSSLRFSHSARAVPDDAHCEWERSAGTPVPYAAHGDRPLSDRVHSGSTAVGKQRKSAEEVRGRLTLGAGFF